MNYAVKKKFNFGTQYDTPFKGANKNKSAALKLLTSKIKKAK